MEEKKNKEEIFFEINNMMDKCNIMCETFLKNNNEKSVEEIKEFLLNNGFFDKDLKEIINIYFNYNNNEKMSQEINEYPKSTPNINKVEINQENNDQSSPIQNNEENINKKEINENNFYNFLLFFQALKFNNKKK